MQKLAKQAHELAMNQRRQSQEAEAKWQARLKASFTDLAKQQRDLAARIEKFRLEVKAGPAGEPANDPQGPALAAAERLGDGRIEAALAEQHRAHDALQALADQIDKALVLGRDPRAAILKLARMQDDLVKQLEKLGDEFPRLPADKARARMAEITKGQKALHDAVGKLDVPESQAKTRQRVQDVTGEAAQMLQRNDALGGFFKMEQARDALQAWAGQFPQAPPAPAAGKDTPADLTVKKQAGESRRLAKDQIELREATQKLLAELAKAQGSSAHSEQHKKDMDNLTQQLMKLAQQTGPESKNASQEAAHAAQRAQKAMAKAQSDKAQGRMTDAKEGEAESALQLQMAGKKLDEAAEAMAQARAGKDDPKDAALQESFRDSQMKLDQAQRQLQQQP